MAFDVSKFLALTVLIASTAAACSDSDKATEGSTGGSSGKGTSGNAGESTQGGGDDGVGGAAAGNGGDAGTVGGAAAGAGGAALGGAAAGGAGGATEVGECLGSLAEGGAAGAPPVEPSLEDLCTAFEQTDCGQEGIYAPSFTLCNNMSFNAESGVAVAIADCLAALSLTDQCDADKVATCFTNLEGQGCSKESSAPACAAMKARAGCGDIDLATCEKIADLISDEAFEGFTGCMNPGDEGSYDPAFAGTCVERLDNCAGLRR